MVEGMPVCVDEGMCQALAITACAVLGISTAAQIVMQTANRIMAKTPRLPHLPREVKPGDAGHLANFDPSAANKALPSPSQAAAPENYKSLTTFSKQ
jgi:hypothetical protein